MPVPRFMETVALVALLTRAKYLGLSPIRLKFIDV